MVIKLRIFEISKENILNLNTDSLFEFCDELTSIKQSNDSRVMFITKAFDNDPRALPNIPIWCEYMKLIAKDYPTLMLFLCDESRELILTSVTNDFSKATGPNSLNLNNKKIKEFLDDVELHMQQLPFISQYADRIQELNNFLDKFFQRINNK